MGKGGGAGYHGSCKGLFLETKPFSCLVQVCELGKQLEQEKARCEGLLREDQVHVIEYFEERKAVLDRKKHACLAALVKAGVDVSRVYDPLIHRVQELQVGLKAF